MQDEENTEPQPQTESYANVQAKFAQGFYDEGYQGETAREALILGYAEREKTPEQAL